MKLLSAQGRGRSFVPDASFQTPNVMEIRFSMARVAKPNRRDATGEASRPGKIPRASELPDAASATKMALVPPTPEVIHKLGQTGLVVGVDIETADWTPKRNPLRKGQFGFYTMSGPEIFEQRLVQIGWYIREVAHDCSEEHGEIIIQPQGFEISTKAANFHGVSNRRAWEEGIPLNAALETFMSTMQRAHEQGGRVIIHNLEFDAGIIDKELSRTGLERWRPIWHDIARRGFCTMDPDVGKWIQMCRGRVFDVTQDSVNVMGLADTLRLLAPAFPATTDVEEFRANKIHTAGADARMHCLIYVVLRELCAKAGTPKDAGL